MFDRTRQWFRVARFRWFFRQEHHTRIENAARWLYYLNGYRRDAGRSSLYADEIYQLKTAFIKYAVEHGYAKNISFQRQFSPCWECDGTGEDPYEDDRLPCWKCKGTGVYSSHILVEFVFQFGDRNYIWHQPKRLVANIAQVNSVWDTLPPDAILRTYENTARDEKTPVHMTAYRHSVLFDALWMWLSLHGVQVRHPEVRPLVQCLLDDIGWYRFKKRVSDEWFFFGVEMRAKMYNLTHRNEIPF